MKRYEIHREQDRIWTLVCDAAGVWVIEYDSHGEARQMFTLDAFEKSEQGQLLATQLAAALTHASDDA